jgi:hypothetical protein
VDEPINKAFIKQFEREVQEAYQRQGSKLRNTVRNSSNVNGSSAVFQIVGKGIASISPNAGTVPLMNLSHSIVECVLSDYYAGDCVDRLDELKVNIDERQVIANAGAYALGRKTDSLIITALSSVGGGQQIADSNIGMTLTKVLSAFQLLGGADVPDDGDRFAGRLEAMERIVADRRILELAICRPR